MVWYGMVWYGVVWCGVVWCGVVWCGVVWYGMVWYGMVWYGMVWYGMVWYGLRTLGFVIKDYGRPGKESIGFVCALAAADTTTTQSQAATHLWQCIQASVQGHTAQVIRQSGQHRMT